MNVGNQLNIEISHCLCSREASTGMEDVFSHSVHIIMDVLGITFKK